MRTKNCRTVSMLLLLFVLLSGMCFDYVKADSFFERVIFLTGDMDVEHCERPVHMSADDAITALVKINHIQLCTAKMLDAHQAATAKRAATRLMGQRRETRLNLGILTFQECASLMGKVTKDTEGMQVYQQYQDGRVVCYMQKSDGKKRI